MSNIEASELVVESGVVNVMGLRKDVYEQSIKLADRIVNCCSRLPRDWAPNLAEQLYRERRPYLRQLVGEEGKFRFTPKSAYDAVEEATPFLQTVVDELVKAYNMTPLSSPEEGQVKAKYDALQLLKETLCTQDYLSNTVPKHIIDEAKNEKGKPFMTSPKLSKWLTKIAGESSELTAWYTNRCPKGDAVLGERNEYELVISTLPHDILGMSYYAPYNFGGPRWVDGYNYTSCMDPVQNSGGSNLNNLPPNLWDETLAVCYLRKVDDQSYREHSRYHEGDEIMNTRMLVRAFSVRGKMFMIGHRVYATNRDEAKLIVNAMELQFPNFVHADTLDNMSGDNKRFTYKHSHIDPEVMKVIVKKGEEEINKIEYAPYNDNSNTIAFGTNYVKVTIPQSFLTKHNIASPVRNEDSDSDTTEADGAAQPTANAVATPTPAPAPSVADMF